MSDESESAIRTPIVNAVLEAQSAHGRLRPLLPLLAGRSAAELLDAVRRDAEGTGPLLAGATTAAQRLRQLHAAELV